MPPPVVHIYFFFFPRARARHLHVLWLVVTSLRARRMNKNGTKRSSVRRKRRYFLAHVRVHHTVW